MSGWDDARAAWDSDVRVARRRARAAIIALIATSAMAAFNGLVTASLLLLFGRKDVSASTWELANALGDAGALAELVLALVTAVLFLSWLAKAVAATDALELERDFPCTPFQGVVAFFIPFVSLVCPYQVLRDLHDHLAPANVPEPAPRPRLDGAASYRRVEMVHAPQAGSVHRAAIGAWWTLYILSTGLGRLSAHVPRPGPSGFVEAWTTLIVSDVVAIAAALLAVLMVRAVDSRLAERHRRVRYASDEELDDPVTERDRRLRRELATIAGLEW